MNGLFSCIDLNCEYTHSIYSQKIRDNKCRETANAEREHAVLNRLFQPTNAEKTNDQCSKSLV